MPMTFERCRSNMALHTVTCGAGELTRYDPLRPSHLGENHANPRNTGALHRAS
jgi:hypothetical protein